MSGGGLVAELVLKYKDNASGAATRSLKAIDQGLKGVTQSGKQAKSASEAAVGAFAKMASARSVLGIRSEKDIQNEIRRTEAAYQRLARSGSASQRELARASDASRQKVAQLREELGKTNRLGNTLRGVGMGVAAYQAAKFAVADPIRQTMSYDRQLANLSNTAYAGQSLDARKVGMRTLDAGIQNAVRTGGGSRDSALATLDKLVASGAFADAGEAARLLPVLTKAGTASNADPTQLADIAIRAKQTFGLTDTGKALGMAIRAGQLGGFELKDMAKWLPQQMAAARMSGLKGESGFAALLAANQATAITAGSKDEAGNNLVNLLTKINSRDTAMDAKRLGIDLSGSLSAARAQGVNSLDAFVNLVGHVVGGDKRYQALQAKAGSATGDEKRATFESMGDILQGSAIGQIVQDRQALMALIGIMNNKQYMAGIRDQLPGAGQGTTDDAFALISQTPSYKAEQAATEKAIAMQTALDKVNPLLGGMADGITNLMRDWPLFSASIIGATTGLTALAAAALAAGGVSMMTGGNAMQTAKKVLTLGGAIPAAGSWLAGLGGGGALGATVATGGLMAAGGAGYAVGSGLNWLGDKAVTAATGGANDSMGGLLYDILHREKEPTRVIVEVQNGNVVASVNETNSRQAKRH